jgi:hypothetical protein
LLHLLATDQARWYSFSNSSRSGSTSRSAWAAIWLTTGAVSCSRRNTERLHHHVARRAPPPYVVVSMPGPRDAVNHPMRSATEGVRAEPRPRS